MSVRGALATLLTTSAIALSLAGPASADSSEIDGSPEEVQEAIESTRVLAGVESLEQAETFNATTSGELVFSPVEIEVPTDEAPDLPTITLESGQDPAIVMGSGSDNPIEIRSALPGTASIASDGTAVFAADGYSVVPLPHEDGSLQIVTVVESESAPERYDYEFFGQSIAEMRVEENGMVYLLDADEALVAGVSTPWAFDSNGNPVDTYFEIDGTMLTQVIEHKGSDAAYPIIADPWLGKNLWGEITIDTYAGQTRVNLNLTQWGKDNWTTPPLVLLGAGWDETLNRSAKIRGALTNKATMHQQYDCHAFGAPFAGEWNLEKFRPDRTVDWSYGVAQHHCNSTTPNKL